MESTGTAGSMANPAGTAKGTTEEFGDPLSTFAFVMSGRFAMDPFTDCIATGLGGGGDELGGGPEGRATATPVPITGESCRCVLRSDGK